MSVLRTTAAVLALLVLGACGRQAAESPATNGMEEMPSEEVAAEIHDEEEQTFAFGHPADVAEADRMVEVQASDSLVFEPPEITVQQGETVTFVVTNIGNLPHDFVLGDEAAQEAHAEEMAASEEDMDMEGMAHGEANAISIPLGKTVELAWTFDGETEGLLYGCHEPGHYEAGMVGTITVNP